MTSPALAAPPRIDRVAPGRRHLGARITSAWLAFGRSPRMLGLDVARALALIGMIAVHTAAVPTLDWGAPETWGGVVEGRSSILFALVAGISIALMSGRSSIPRGYELRGVRLRLAGRALAVLVIGLVLESLGSGIAVILPVYGVLFLIVIPFVGLRRRTLLVTAGAIALFGPVTVGLLRTLSQGTSGPGMDLVVVGTYPLCTWLSLLLVGIAIGRSDLRSKRLVAGLLAAGILLAVGGTAAAGVVQSALGTLPTAAVVSESSTSTAVTTPGASVDLTDKDCETFGDGSVWCSGHTPSLGSGSVPGPDAGSGTFDPIGNAGGWSAVLAGPLSAEPHSGGTFEIIASGGFALAVVAACLLLAGPLRWFLLPLAALGTIPLTAYAAHVLSFAVLISPFMLAPELAGWGDGVGFWAVSVGSLLLFGLLWALFVGRGPLERVVAWASRRIDRPRS